MGFKTVSSIKYHKYLQVIVDGNSDVAVDTNNITFSLDGTMGTGGFYWCFYSRFPNTGDSNKTEVVIQGNDFKSFHS